MLRRLFDIAFSMFGLVVTAPLLLITGILINLDSPGPVLWLSQREGKDGKPFRVYNFRTLHEGKRTRVGRFIANYPLDHLPQLFNLLEGDTTLIGPRPEMADRVNLSDPSWQRILTVMPGLGCFAVLELATRYNTSSQEVKNRVEIQYVDARSAALDLRIFVRAIRALIVSRGNVKLRGKPNVQDEKDR